MPREPRPIEGPYFDQWGEFFLVPLTKFKFAKISREDVERVGKYFWYASLESRGTKWYAIRREAVNGKRVKIRMHRFVLDQPPGMLNDMVVDHVGHDSLDNRRSRLEIITQDENMARSEGWKKRKEPSEEPCL